ncbi:MAG: hypothetical protein KGP12_02735 [Actinomycetales bacterium]|nr:hypothetical protein [Actinomycetales bacterium]
MAIDLPAPLVEPVVGALMAGIDVNGGPTHEQVKVLQAIVARVWSRPDLDVRRVRPVSPGELADHLGHTAHRDLFHEIHLTLEACRHPQAPEQVEAVERYAAALEVGGEDLRMFRDLVTQGVQAASADYARFLDASLQERAEPSLASLPVDPDHPEMALAEKLEAFAEYAPDSLGRAYITFYEQFGLRLPGLDPSATNHFFVSHDMTHTIAGLSTTIAGEVALSAFQFAMNNNRINRAALLASLVAHEAGFAHPGHLRQADTAVLADDSAVLLLSQEMARGGQCGADFSLVDHFDLAPLPLAEIRAAYGVRPPANASDGHHFLW